MSVVIFRVISQCLLLDCCMLLQRYHVVGKWLLMGVLGLIMWYCPEDCLCFSLTGLSTSIIFIKKMASLVWCCQSSLNLCKYQMVFKKTDALNTSWDIVMCFIMGCVFSVSVRLGPLLRNWLLFFYMLLWQSCVPQASAWTSSGRFQQQLCLKNLMWNYS